MDLFQRIEELMMNYSDARRTIGAFVLEHHNRLHDLSIQDVADETFSSKATVVRFAKTLGYSGWRMFLRDFIKENQYANSHKTDIDANFPFTASSDSEEIIKNLKTAAVESIQDTAELLDPEALEKAARYLKEAGRILLLGLTPNVYLGELFQRKMLTIGINVEVHRHSEMGTAVRSLSKGDCAVVISYSGNNKEAKPMRYLETLKREGVTVIGITSDGRNYLRQMADVVLTMSSKERLYSKIATFSTEDSINYILNCLFACLFVMDYDRNLDKRLKTARMLETEREAVIRSLKEES